MRPASSRLLIHSPNFPLDMYPKVFASRTSVRRYSTSMSISCNVVFLKNFNRNRMILCMVSSTAFLISAHNKNRSFFGNCMSALCVYCCISSNFVCKIRGFLALSKLVCCTAISFQAAAIAAAASVQIVRFQSPYFATRRPMPVPGFDDAPLTLNTKAPACEPSPQPPL